MYQVAEKTIAQLQADLQSGKVTSVQLVEAYLARIAAYDSGRLRSVMEINPDALFIGEKCDIMRQEGSAEGNLFGIPVLIKDNIDTGDKMHTSAGSLALQNNYAKEDSGVADKLRDAGAIILGKTNMTEFANFMTVGMPGGYSGRGGQTVNPYQLELTPSGSSAGSAVAAACSFAAACVGTETNGSIVSPAKNNCIVGIKPTVGLVSRRGIIPISHTQDTAGPMARTVADAAALLTALSGIDHDGEEATLTIPGEYFDMDYTQSIGKSIENWRIGYCVPEQGLTIEEQDSLELAKKVLTAAGAVLLPVVLPYHHDGATAKRIMCHEFKAGLNAYLAKTDCGVKTLSGVVDYNSKHSADCLKYGQTLLTDCDKLSGKLCESDYLKALLQTTAASRNAIDSVIASHQLDLLIQANYNSVHAVSGYPAITVPTGLPTKTTGKSIFFIGRKWCEDKLIAAAYAFEQGSKCRKAPQLYSIDVAKDTDVDAVYGLYRAVAEGDNCDWDDVYPPLAFIKADVARRWLFMVKDEEQKLVGAISIDSNKDLDDCGMMWSAGQTPCVLSRLCVLPAMQGQGLGKKILQSGLQLAKQRGFTAVRILASKTNATAIQMYESLGYKCTGEVYLYGMDFRGYEVLL